jgi:CDP-6-deoxy-D-xylo-4-hexulose-3-dehydrase
MRQEGKGFRAVGDLVNTERIMRDTFWVGVYPGMTDGMIEFVIETIKNAFSRRS